MSDAAFGLAFADKTAMLRSLHVQPRHRIRPTPERSRACEGPEPSAVIVGDNLEALRVLLPAYSAEIQTIYIDPPYNTGHDFVYRDRFAETSRSYLERTGQVDDTGSALRANFSTAGRYHSAWLSMMYPRLWLARQLLHDDGVLFCSIDDHEVHHLRVLLDEIFGEECFIAQVVVVSNRGGRDYMRIAVNHEYVLCYGATPKARIREVEKRGEPPRYQDARGAYDLRELRNRNPKFHPGNRPNLFYPVYVHPQLDDDAGAYAVSVEARPGYSIVVEPRNSTGGTSVWRWGRPKLEAAIVADDPRESEVVARPRRDGGWNVYEKHRKRTTKARSLWADPEVRSERGTIDLRERLGAAVFDHPKPVELVRRCVELGTDPDGIVLDFFAGSGTTAEAVLAQNRRDEGSRRTILVQYPEPTSPDSVARHEGYETIDQILHARLAAASADGAWRWFRLEPERDSSSRLPSDSPGEFLLAMRERLEQRRTTTWTPWALALARGVTLDAEVRSQGSFTVFRDRRGRCLAASDETCIAAEAVEALDLPPGTTIATRLDALGDGDRLRLARRYSLWTP